MSEKMVQLASEQHGFLGAESVRDEAGFGITISYWKSLEDIQAWKENREHKRAQKLGKEQWYDSFMTRICFVERDSSADHKQ